MRNRVEAEAATGIRRSQAIVFAATAGFTVASTYYFQPLFPVVGASLHIPASSASWISTVLQLGYALGLFLLVPLGDYFDRRRLVPLLMLLSAVGLVGISVSGSLGELLAWCAVVGVTSAVAQVVVGMVATIASPPQRGAAIGNVMTGLLLGILLARTVAGLVAQYANWRLVFVGSAVAVASLAWFSATSIPAIPKGHHGTYRQLLASLWHTFLEEPVVRRAALLGALNFACFSIFWNTSSLHLSAPPLGLGAASIGLFGLVGVAGALAARLAGRMADKGRQWLTSLLMNVLIAASFLMLFVMPDNIWMVIAAVLVLDFGVQGSHISNQSMIFSIRPEARSRITGIYMTAYFLGGSVGSFFSTLAYRDAGYRAVLVGALAFAVVAIGARTIKLRAPA
ncbi:MAG: MFS transporter [Actinomycetota bacterium]|nr:MFS transporter [Actinomycetota bacterium]